MAVDWEAGVDLSLSTSTPELGSGAVAITATLTNARAGHMVPTGDPERYLELTLTARDVGGSVVGTASSRIGQVWEWWPVSRKLSDNRIAPGESSDLLLTLDSADGPLTVTATLDHVRISPENASFHDLGDYPTRRRVQSIEHRVLPEARTEPSSP